LTGHSNSKLDGMSMAKFLSSIGLHRESGCRYFSPTGRTEEITANSDKDHL